MKKKAELSSFSSQNHKKMWENGVWLFRDLDLSRNNSLAIDFFAQTGTATLDKNVGAFLDKQRHIILLSVFWSTVSLIARMEI